MAEVKTLEFTNGLNTEQISGEMDQFINLVKMNRKGFERRWYDNNFFDDGFHFRYVSRTTGRIVDQNEKSLAFAPNRAIPKASRQIRGVANLILQFEPTPVIYPEYIPKASYPDFPVPPEVAQQMKSQGQQVPQSFPNPAYQKAIDKAKFEAQKKGAWLEYEWQKLELKDQLILMVILAAKHGVSYMQIYPHERKQKICTKVYDAFDIWLMGQYDEIYDSPMIVKTAPTLISKIKGNSNFDENQRMKISADNKFATSEIKQAYMQSRFGSGAPTDSVATLELKEGFVKEQLTNENAIKVAKDLGESFKRLEEGDQVIRQVFSAGGVWLYDKYTTLKEYPFVDYRFEPGAIYQTPLIERFIPANKSLDIVMSRLERYTNTMSVGLFQKRKGENYQVSNASAAQVIEYENKPLEQMRVEGLPSSFFNFIEILHQNIEEQGASISALNKIPSGLRSGVAIESLKASEYANLKIPTDQLKKTTKRIAERMLDIGANYYIQPETVKNLDNKGNPDYFQVIGQVGMEARQKAQINSPFDGVIINEDAKVRIEVESGLGFTEVGKKETMQQIVTFMEVLLKNQLVTPEAVKVVVQKFFEIYKFGSTQEFMDAMEDSTNNMTEDQITQMKVALAQVVKDLGLGGAEAQGQQVDTTKVGVLEALKESGLLKGLQGLGVEPVKEQIQINYKDSPEDIKRQLEARAGLVPSKSISPAGSKQIVDHQKTEISAHQVDAQAAAAQNKPVKKD